MTCFACLISNLEQTLGCSSYLHLSSLSDNSFIRLEYDVTKFPFGTKAEGDLFIRFIWIAIVAEACPTSLGDPPHSAIGGNHAFRLQKNDSF